MQSTNANNGSANADFTLISVEELGYSPVLKVCADEGKRDSQYECSKAEMLRRIYGNLKAPTKGKAGDDVEGVVMMGFTIDQNGKVEKPYVVFDDARHGCADIATRIVGPWEFEPIKIKGKAAKVKMVVPITFNQLDNKTVAHGERMPLFPSPIQSLDEKAWDKNSNKLVTQFIKENLKQQGISNPSGTYKIGYLIDQQGNARATRIEGADENIKSALNKAVDSLPLMMPGNSKGRTAKVSNNWLIEF